MPEAYRRVVLKPPGLGADASARLAERLAAAVELQQQLASQCPHILQFTGGLEQDARAFFVQHEPAHPPAVASFFDPEAPAADETALLRTAMALADALRVAHETSRELQVARMSAQAKACGSSAVHGGLCAGVVLETAEGVHKVTDFGFAPALCAVLGVESYLELAVGPNTEGALHFSGTGVWEVLSAEVATRDDRICGFIDPEKYGSQMLATFEAGSDIIAAGILLHLLAEHHHPMLQDAEDHRLVVTAESLAFFPYNGARRKSLRESSDPRVQCWCELVARMLSRLPKDRPSASDICSALARVGVRPVGPGEHLKPVLDDAESLLKKGQWKEAEDKASRVVSVKGASGDVLDRAHALLQQCQAHKLLDQARQSLKGDDWRSARGPLEQLSAMSALSAEVAEQADKLAGRLQHNLRAQEELDGIETACRQTAAADPAQGLSAVQGWIERTEKLLADKALVSPLRDHVQRLRTDLSVQREDFAAKAKQIQAEQAVVTGWFNALKAAWDREQWLEVEALLQDRPSTSHWPKGIKDQSEEFEKLYGEVQTAAAHIQSFRKALDDNNLDLAERLSAIEPRLTRPPPKVRAELDQLAARLRATKAKAVDHVRAQQWIESVQKAVGTKDWAFAARQLGEKPSLNDWPSEVVELEKTLRAQVERELAEQERIRLKIDSWLQVSDHAARKGDFEQAIAVLDAPPIDAARLPKSVREEVGKRKQTYTADLREARRKQLEQATQAARSLAAALARDVITKDLPGLLTPAVLDAKVGPIKWTSEKAPTRGGANLEIAVRPLAERGQDTAISLPFSFELDSDPPRILDDDGSIRRALCTHLTKVIKSAQQARVADLQTPLRKGLFPNAGLKIKSLEQSEQAVAAVHLLGTDVPEPRIDNVKLAWDAVKLAWTFADVGDVVRRAVEVAVGKARELVRPSLLKESETLRRYASVLGVNVLPQALPDPSAMPASLDFECRLAVEPRGRDPHPLPAVTVAYRQLGTVVIDAGLKQTEAELLRFVVAAQKSSQAALKRDLRAKLASAPARVKLAVLTKRIARPVYQIQFEVQPKRGDKLTLTAPWNSDTFTFDLPDNARAQMDTLLQQLAQAPAATKQGAAARRPGRRAYALTAVAALVVLAAVVPFVRRSETNSTSSNSSSAATDTDIGNVNANDNVAVRGAEQVVTHPPDKSPDEKPPDDDSTGKDTAPSRTLRTADEAIAAVRAVLDTSKYMADGGTQNQILEQRGVTEEQASVTCWLPGLKNPAMSITLSRDPQQRALTEADQEALMKGVRDVDALLNDVPGKFTFEVNRALVTGLNSLFIDTGRLDMRIAADIRWTPNADRTAWSATDIPLAVVFKPAGGSAETAAADGLEQIELARIEIDLTVKNEMVASTQPERIGSLKNLVVETLRRRQGDSLNALPGDLNKRLQGLDATVSLQPAAVQNLEEAVEVTIKSPRLAPRLFTVEWNQRRLDFDPQTLTAGLDGLLSVHEALGAIEEFIKEKQDHWIREVYREVPAVLLVEVEAPGEAAWNLAVVAPWAAEDVVQLQDPDDLLPISIPIPATWNQAGLVQAFQRLGPPPYWNIAKEYVVLAAGHRFLSDSEELHSFAEGIETEAGRLKVTQAKEVVDYLRSDPPPSLITPRIELAGDGSPEPGGFDAAMRSGTTTAPALKLTVTARLGLNAAQTALLDGALDETAVRGLDDALLSLMKTKVPAAPAGSEFAATCTLTLSQKTRGQAGIAMQWSDLAPVIDGLVAISGEAEELNQLLTALPERFRLEADLYGALGGLSPADGQAVQLPAAQAAELLKQIWIAKGVQSATAEQQGKDLEALSVARQEAFNRLNIKGFFQKGRRVSPTIFAEYFSGPRSAFAVAWSVKLPKRPEPGVIQEGPFLIHLCSNNTLSNAVESQSGIGKLLFDPVLGKLSDATAARFNSPFDLQVGIVLAPDDRLGGLDLATVAFNERTSRFKAVHDRPDAPNYEFDDRTWNTLGDLRGESLKGESLKDGACDYALVPTVLSDPGPVSRELTAQRAWAMTVLDDALRAGTGQ